MLNGTVELLAQACSCRLSGRVESVEERRVGNAGGGGGRRGIGAEASRRVHQLLRRADLPLEPRAARLATRAPVLLSQERGGGNGGGRGQRLARERAGGQRGGGELLLRTRTAARRAVRQQLRVQAGQQHARNLLADFLDPLRLQFYCCRLCNAAVIGNYSRLIVQRPKRTRSGNNDEVKKSQVENQVKSEHCDATP